MDTRKLQQLIVFYGVQILAIVGIFTVEANFYYLALGWVLFPGLASAVIMHRGISHRSFEVKPWMQVLSCLAVQGSPIWWAGIHRGLHHPFADEDGDAHSPNHGLFHGYIGWLHKDHTIRPRTVTDLLRDNFLRQVEKFYPLIVVTWGAILAVIDLQLFFWFWVIPAAWSYHQESVVNTLCHYKGLRDLNILGLFTWGQTIHKSHHENPRLYRFGKLDPTVIFLPFIKRN